MRWWWWQRTCRLVFDWEARCSAVSRVWCAVRALTWAPRLSNRRTMSTWQCSTATCRHDRPDVLLTLLTCTPVNALAPHTYTHTQSLRWHVCVCGSKLGHITTYNTQHLWNIQNSHSVKHEDRHSLQNNIQVLILISNQYSPKILQETSQIGLSMITLGGYYDHNFIGDVDAMEPSTACTDGPCVYQTCHRYDNVNLLIESAAYTLTKWMTQCYMSHVNIWYVRVFEFQLQPTQLVLHLHKTFTLSSSLTSLVLQWNEMKMKSAMIWRI